jgi:hypothetical protein
MKTRAYFSLGIFAILSVLLFLMWSSNHEEAHKVIFQEMCSNAKVEVSSNLLNFTMKGADSFMYTQLVSADECDKNMQLAQAINESVGYQFGGLFAIATAALCAMFAYMVMGDDE